MSIDWTKVVTPADKFEQARERKRSEIAAARFEAETAGIDVNGFTVRTDRESGLFQQWRGQAAEGVHEGFH